MKYFSIAATFILSMVTLASTYNPNDPNDPSCLFVAFAQTRNPSKLTMTTRIRFPRSIDPIRTEISRVDGKLWRISIALTEDVVVWRTRKPWNLPFLKTVLVPVTVVKVPEGAFAMQSVRTLVTAVTMFVMSAASVNRLRKLSLRQSIPPTSPVLEPAVKVPEVASATKFARTLVTAAPMFVRNVAFVNLLKPQSLPPTIQNQHSIQLSLLVQEIVVKVWAAAIAMNPALNLRTVARMLAMLVVTATKVGVVFTSWNSTAY